MPTIGPPAGPPDELGLLTVCSYALLIGANDTLVNTIFSAGYARRVVPQGNGTIYIKRALDPSFVPYAATAGQPIDGNIVAIGGTGTGSSAITVNLEV